MTSSAEPPLLEARPPNDHAYAFAVYALYALGFFTIITAVVGVIVAHVKSSTSTGIWRSHFIFQIRTFWIGLLSLFVGFVLLDYYIGALILLLWTIWTLVRIIKGAILLHDRRQIDRPTSLLFG